MIDPKRRTGWVLVVLGVIVLAGGLIYWLRIPPQMGPNEEVFETVDALFTAVTAKDEPRLADCEVRLKGYVATGKLPDPAWRHLNGNIQKARGGRWDSAAESLYGFMLAQRRDGYQGTPKPAPVTKKKR